MHKNELMALLQCGEDSTHQFKRTFTNADAVAAELVAFSNSEGGMLFLGVEDDGRVSGLSSKEISRLNQLISNSASQHVRPAINPISENIQTDSGVVMLIRVAGGINMPYTDNQGRIWVKTGADKRHVTAREELQRLFQRSGLVYAEEALVPNSMISDISDVNLNHYFEKRYSQRIEETGLSLATVTQNMNLSDGHQLNVAGLLLFACDPQRFRPAFIVKAVAFSGNSITGTVYNDSDDITGTLPEQYEQSLHFIKRNLRRVQAGQGVNSIGQLEVPQIVLEEILVNALVHRDYFISAPVQLLIFNDRIEIVSPGHLPNHLTVEKIRYGLSNMRNPVIASHAAHLLPYRGLGSGIPRALESHSSMKLEDDREGNRFKVTLYRP